MCACARARQCLTAPSDDRGARVDRARSRASWTAHGARLDGASGDRSRPRARACEHSDGGSSSSPPPPPVYHTRLLAWAGTTARAPAAGEARGSIDIDIDIDPRIDRPTPTRSTYRSISITSILHRYASSMEPTHHAISKDTHTRARARVSPYVRTIASTTVTDVLGLCGIHRCGVSIDRGSDRDRCRCRCRSIDRSAATATATARGAIPHSAARARRFPTHLRTSTSNSRRSESLERYVTRSASMRARVRGEWATARARRRAR